MEEEVTLPGTVLVSRRLYKKVSEAKTVEEITNVISGEVSLYVTETLDLGTKDDICKTGMIITLTEYDNGNVKSSSCVYSLETDKCAKTGRLINSSSVRVLKPGLSEFTVVTAEDECKIVTSITTLSTIDGCTKGITVKEALGAWDEHNIFIPLSETIRHDGDDVNEEVKTEVLYSYTDDRAGWVSISEYVNGEFVKFTTKDLLGRVVSIDILNDGIMKYTYLGDTTNIIDQIMIKDHNTTLISHNTYDDNGELICREYGEFIDLYSSNDSGYKEVKTYTYQSK